jgi:hypothetical protein
MRKSDLTELLSVLDANERKSFLKYMQSPYHVDQKTAEPQMALLSLKFTQIDQHGIDLDDETEYFTVFGSVPKVKNKLEKLRSELLTNLRRFIVFEQTASRYNGELEHLPLAQYFLNKNLNNHYLRSRSRLLEWEATQDKAGWLPQQFADVIEMHSLYAFYASRSDYSELSAAFSALTDAINTHFGINRLYHSLVYQSYQRFHNKDMQHEINEVMPILNWSGLSPFYETLLGSNIKNIIEIQNNQDLEHGEFLLAIEKTHSRFKQDMPQFHPELSRNLAGALFNAIPKTKSHELRAIALKIYQSNLEYLLSDKGTGYVHENELLGGINFSILLGDITWAKWFLSSAIGKIQSETSPVGSIEYAEAFILYTEQRYEEALDKIVHGHFDLIQLKCTAKVLEVQILYDMQDNQLESRVEAAKLFFFREKAIPEIHRIGNNRFIDLVKRLIRPGNTFNVKKLERILEEVNAPEPIARKAWLEKITQNAIEKAKRMS